MVSGIASRSTDALEMQLRVRKVPHLGSFLKDQAHFSPLQTGKVGLCFQRNHSHDASAKCTWPRTGFSDGCGLEAVFLEPGWRGGCFCWAFPGIWCYGNVGKLHPGWDTNRVECELWEALPSG